ncbi:MAG: rhodanese-like domain-containing protein [Desulfuromonas sp.]|nr:rhodanese-like domain-containing protein [Desulfuromonas sp.]
MSVTRGSIRVAVRGHRPILSARTTFLWLFLLAFILLSGSFSSAAQLQSSANTGAEQFPLRAFYPSVQTIDTATFLHQYAHAIIVDVRSPFEFAVVRINGAKHIDLSTPDFVAVLETYRAAHSATPLIFYCNDPSCSRAFRAAALAHSAGFDHIYTYDAGVFALLEKVPELVTLMETTPAQAQRVVTKESYENALLDFASFKERSSAKGSLVIDIRDIYRRQSVPNIDKVRNIPMEALLQGITNRIWLEKRLFIFDERGEQSRSLQYFLQANGYTEYAFLRGGVQQLPAADVHANEQKDAAEVSINQSGLLQMLVDQRLRALDLELFALIIANISFENHSVVDLAWIKKNIPDSLAEVLSAARRLQRCGYLLFDTNHSALICHISPRLAWKGKMSGVIWSRSVAEFKPFTD